MPLRVGLVVPRACARTWACARRASSSALVGRCEDGEAASVCSQAARVCSLATEKVRESLPGPARGRPRVKAEEEAIVI